MNIAVCGAGGRIGFEVCRYLKILFPDAKLTAVSRSRRGRIEELLDWFPDTQWRQADIGDLSAVAALSAEHDMIVNAAGTSGDRGFSAANAIVRDCPLVEVGYNEAFEQHRGEWFNHSCIYGAGTAPGFVGILSRALLEGCGDPRSRKLWYLVREELSYSAAQDMAMLFASASGQGNGCAGNGKTVEHSLFSGELYAMQYYDSEARDIDRLYNVSQTELYMLRDDDILSMAAGCGGNTDILRDKLINASRLALNGREEMIRIVCEVKGSCDSTALIQAASQSALSGCMAACIAEGVLKGRCEEKVYRASESPLWKVAFETMKKTDVFQICEIYEILMSEIEETESGEL